MKKFLKLGLLSLLRFFYKFLKCKDEYAVVLMYHSVGNSGWEFSVTPEIFEKQTRYLKRNDYNFLTAGDLYDIISSKRKLTGKNVLLTFDDGYRDFMTEAVPILNKYGVPAILFIHTNRSSEQLKNSLPLLDWADIKLLSDNFEIGSHSHSHPNLKNLSASELGNEVLDSDRIIQEVTSKKPETFAYPFGVFNQQTVEILKKNHYKLGFTIDRGTVRASDDSFRIKRFGVANDTSFVEFKARVTGASDWYEKLADLVR